MTVYAVAGHDFSGFPDIPLSTSAAQGGFAPNSNLASEFGMPEIGSDSNSAVHSVPMQPRPGRIHDPTRRAAPSQHTYQNGEQT